MRIAVHPADEGGCGMYRITWPARALIDQGFDIVFDEALPVIWDRVWFGEAAPPEANVIGVGHPGVDVVVLQRPLQRNLADVIPHLQAHGVAVVVEIDDDFDTIPPTNPAFRDTHPKHRPHRNRDHLKRAARQANLVTVTTPALAKRYGGHGRVAVLPNFVPERYLSIDAERDGVTVGWSGSVITHPGDLEETHGGVGRAVDAARARFAIVGTGQGVQRRLGLSGAPLSCGWVPIDVYPERVATFDVGIVPLAHNAFNEAKSNLKMSEMAALGVPAVASPTSENRALHDLGVGLLADRGRDWERHVRTLLTDDARRAELTAAGRAVMAQRTIEAHAWRWMEAWSQAAVEAAKARVPA